MTQQLTSDLTELSRAQLISKLISQALELDIDNKFIREAYKTQMRNAVTSINRREKKGVFE